MKAPELIISPFPSQSGKKGNHAAFSDSAVLEGVCPEWGNVDESQRKRHCAGSERCKSLRA